ncbi:MAG: NHL repeat-containing protein, partial [Leptospira sp.]|nr:NHL repeat-containing protein [Leptospira sp.]
MDPEGFLYILSFETANIVKFNPNGMPVANFRGGLGRTLEGPLFFTLYNKYLYVSDFKSDRIYIISDTGSFESRFGETGREPGKFHGPSGIAISPNGEIYVSDSGNNRIQKFNMTGKFIQEFGLTGNGKLNNPTGLAIDNRNEIFVIDKENKRVVIFDDEGNFLREISHKNMKKPHSIKFHEGRIYIADEENGLMIYNAEEDKWTRLSSFMDDTGKFRKLDRPFSTAYDSSSSLYTVDYERHRVDIFSPKNTLSSNLNLSLEHVDTSRFPDVSLTLHVKNRTDLDITGINRTAFRIFENDNPVPLPGLFNMKKINDRISISLVFENSKKINEFSKTLVEYGSLNALKTDQTLENSFLGKFFKSFTKLDKIEVI